MNDNGVQNYNGKYKYHATYSAGPNNYRVNKTQKKKKSNGNGLVIFGVIIFFFFLAFALFRNSDVYENIFSDKSFTILSTYENKDMEETIIEYGKKHKRKNKARNTRRSI